MTERLFLRLDGDAVQAPEAQTPPGTLRAWPVSARLRAHVAHILEYREIVPDGDEVIERVLPDGAVRLILNFGEAPVVGGRAGERLEVVGASAEAAVVRLTGRIEGLSISLRPGAAAGLLGVPAGELAGRALSIDELWKGDAREAMERMAAAATNEERARVLGAMLERRTKEGAGASAAALEAVKLISAAQGARTLRDVARTIGVGERRLQQLFFAEVGLSPRAFGRVARLHGLLRALRARPRLPLAQVAVDAGFYDQSHLANEFRALSGLSPSEFLARTISGSSKT